MKEMTVKELHQMMENDDDFQLIDVREPDEVELAEMGGQHIPMGEIMSRVDEIKRDIPVVIHCRSGARSAAVVTALENNLGFDNLYNLRGGILAWAHEIDPSLHVM